MLKFGKMATIKSVDTASLKDRQTAFNNMLMESWEETLLQKYDYVKNKFSKSLKK